MQECGPWSCKVQRKEHGGSGGFHQRVITTTEEWDVRTQMEMVPGSVSAWRESQFTSWLQQKLEGERVALVTRLQEKVSHHLAEHRESLLADLEAQMTSALVTAKRPISVDSDPAVAALVPPHGKAMSPLSGKVAPLPEVNVQGQLLNNAGKSESFSLSNLTPPPGSVDPPRPEPKKSASMRTREDSDITLDTTEPTEAPSSRTSSKDKRRSKRFQSLAQKKDLNSSLGTPSGCTLSGLVQNPLFEVIVSCLIILNIVVMALEVQYVGCQIGHVLNHPDCVEHSAEAWPWAADAFTVVNLVFQGIFFVEFFLRIAAMRSQALKSGWMWFDLVIIVLSSLDVVERLVDSLYMSVNPAMMRLARIARMLRMIKVLKARDVFSSLFLLVKSIQASKNALMWSLLLLFFMMTCVGLLMNQMIYGYLIDSAESEHDRRAVFDYFGTYTRMIITMFELTFGNWAPPSRLLMAKINEAWGLFIVVYRCMFCFALVNVTAAVFITETNRVAAGDDEVMMMRKERTQKAHTKKLQELFKELDDSGDGFLTFDEFHQLMHDEVMLHYLSNLDLECADLDELFNLLDDGDGKVESSEFIRGIQMLKGQAKQLDVLTITNITRKMNETLLKLEQGLLPSRQRLIE